MNIEDQYIIDVGAHEGNDTLYYLKRGFKVISFEANPKLSADIRAKASEHGYSPDVRNKAVSDQSGELEFYVNRFNTAWSSLDAKLGSRREDADIIKVPSCRLDEELAAVDGPIHYVKIDIEGYDNVALSQVLMCDSRPRFVSVENGSQSMIELLARCGYDGFKLSNQKYVLNQTIPQNTQYKHAEHKFEQGDSGMFGTDLPGRWLERDEALAVIEGLTLGRQAAPNNLWAATVGWFDLHARYKTDQ